MSEPTALAATNDISRKASASGSLATRSVSEGTANTFNQYMKDATLMINKPSLLMSAINMIEALPLTSARHPTFIYGAYRTEPQHDRQRGLERSSSLEREGGRANRPHSRQASENPICWMLVTTLPIVSDEDVQRIIRSDCVRWQIEIYQARYYSRHSLDLLAA